MMQRRSQLRGLVRSQGMCSVSESCLTLCDPVDCAPPGSSVHGILQARILEWVAMPSSRGASRPGDPTQVSLIAGKFFTIWTNFGHMWRERRSGQPAWKWQSVGKWWPFTLNSNSVEKWLRIQSTLVQILARPLRDYLISPWLSFLSSKMPISQSLQGLNESIYCIKWAQNSTWHAVSLMCCIAHLLCIILGCRLLISLPYSFCDLFWWW